MTTHNITLDGSYTVAKGSRADGWKYEMTLDLSKVPSALVTDLLLHGLKQKVADAASGAKTEAEAEAAMGKAWDAIVAGDWSSRVAGSGVGEEVRIARQIARIALKAKVGAASPAWKDFTGMADADQAAKLDAIFAKNEAKLRPAVTAKLAALAQERADRKALETDLDL